MMEVWPKWFRIGFGALCFAPLAGLVTMFALMFFAVGGDTRETVLVRAQMMGTVMMPMALGLLVGVILLVICVVDAWRSPAVTPEMKGTWTILLVLLPPIALPVYWGVVVMKWGAPESGQEVPGKRPPC
jgi:hypothetical protein